MAEPRPTQPPEDLDRALRDLGQHLDWPSNPDLLPGIRLQLTQHPRRQSLLSRLRPATAPGRLAWATAAVVAVILLVLTISDSTRSTVADRLGLPGVSISTEPTVTSSPGRELQLGTLTTLDEAANEIGSGLVAPPDSVLGQPDAVYVLNAAGIVQVTYVYRPRADVPEVGDTGVGLLISQFDGHTNESFIQKQLGPDTSIEMTEVNGQAAFWISGHPHVFYYERPDGEIREETIRLAANVLLWEQDGKTLRIESSLDRDATVGIAEAMRQAR
jgi:hypothetical protein